MAATARIRQPLAPALALAVLVAASSELSQALAASPPLAVADFDSKPIIVQIPGGELLAVFLRTLDGRVSLTAAGSRDGGRTWGSETTMLRLPPESGGWGGPEVLVGRDGELHVFLVNDRPGDASSELTSRYGRLDIWHARTRAERTRWEPPKRIWLGYTGALNSVAQLESGRILLPFSFATDRRWSRRGDGLEAFTYTGHFDCTLVYSDDGGDTWETSPTSLRVPTPDIVSAYGAVEPVVLELQDGRVWMLIRTQLGRFYESFSADGREWSAPRPTSIISSDSPAGLARLSDGRIVLLWNCCLRFPYAYGGRHVLHAAISEDDGSSWRGYREVARDPLRGEPPPPSGDHGTAYPFPAVTSDDHVLFTTGQGDGRTHCVLLDPDWIEETRQRDDFSGGLDSWHVFGTRGVELVPHPDGGSRRVLRVRKTDAGWPAAAVWNFPSGRRGRVRVRLRLEPGLEGALVVLTDHFSVPFDAEDEIHGVFSVGLRDTPDTPADGRWRDLQVSWDDSRTADVRLEGKPMPPIRRRRESPGLGYLRLRSTARGTEAAGFLVESVEAVIDDR